MNNNKVLKMTSVIFACVGFILFVAGTCFCIKTLNYNNKIKTTGVISSVVSKTNNSDLVYVTYEIGGKVFESKLNGYSSSFVEGKEIDIYYNKNNPNDISVKSLDYLMLLIPGMGIIFLVVGGSIFSSIYLGKFKERELRQTGELITATYIETKVNNRVYVNNKNPYIIICKWTNPEDGETYIFKSKNLWTNPEDYIKEKNINTFPVYINMNNKKKYFVDIEEIADDIN